MTHQEIRRKFLDFFKTRGHTVVPSSSLVPDDPSVLFTTAGMQQFKPYYTGETDAMKDFGSLNAASVQKSFRTSSIDEVGDDTHGTFFEMLGNFSFGGYFKREAIKWAYEFITQEVELKIDYVSVFGGEENIPADEESEKIWKSLDSHIVIKKLGRKDNFWGPTGDEGPCGPSTEIYVNGIEIWNIVFNQYYCQKDKKLMPLKTPGIDTGMGLERLATVLQEKDNIFETDLFHPLILHLPEDLDLRVKRIIADHVRAISFLIADGITPSNKDRGYVLRKLIRRVTTQSQIHAEIDFGDLFAWICQTYGEFYPELSQQTIVAAFNAEEQKFRKTLRQGLKELERYSSINAAQAFKLYESFGLPFEVTKEVGGEKTKNLSRADFDAEFRRHQEESQKGAEKKFGGHGLLLDTGELKAANEEEVKIVTRLHTATHLLHASLRKILGPEVKQAGSDITAERLRFDFSFPRKLTPEEIKKVEDLVNKVIEKDLSVTKKEMPYEEALKTGALSFFRLKYPNRVNVYTIGPELAEGQPFSKELCGGPHVTHSGKIGRFKIKKEEAVSAGVRRIRAIVE